MTLLHAIYVFVGMLIGLACKLAIDWLLKRRNRHTLKERLKRWWRSGLTDVPETIQYRTREGIRTGRPVRATGLHLLVEQAGPGRECLLISAGEAVDREKFWAIWRYYNGRLAKMVDEDGDEWVPE